MENLLFRLLYEQIDLDSGFTRTHIYIVVFFCE